MNEPFDPEESAAYLYSKRRLEQIFEENGIKQDMEDLYLFWKYLMEESNKSGEL